MLGILPKFALDLYHGKGSSLKLVCSTSYVLVALLSIRAVLCRRWIWIIVVLIFNAFWAFVWLFGILWAVVGLLHCVVSYTVFACNASACTRLTLQRVECSCS